MFNFLTTIVVLYLMVTDVGFVPVVTLEPDMLVYVTVKLYQSERVSPDLVNEMTGVMALAAVADTVTSPVTVPLVPDNEPAV